MPKGTMSEPADVHARILEVMEQLGLPSPEKMLRRIESMLAKSDREAVLQQLLEGCEGQPSSEVRRKLRNLLPSREDWAREVDQLLQGYPPG